MIILSFKTTRKALLLTFSTFNALLLEPKCHTILQYNKFGSIKESYNFIPQSSEINLPILLKARILSEALNHNAETWWSKFNLSSNCIPSSFTQSTLVSNSCDTLKSIRTWPDPILSQLPEILRLSLAYDLSQAILWRFQCISPTRF